MSGQIQNRRAGLHGDAANLAEKIDVGAAGIFRRKFHFSHVLACQLDHRADGFQRLFASHVQFHLQVQIRGRQENVHARECAACFERLHRSGHMSSFRARASAAIGTSRTSFATCALLQGRRAMRSEIRLR